MPNYNSYWLYLEPYANLIIKQDSFILYNTLSGENIERIANPKLANIVNELDKSDNLWCIEFNESELRDNEILEFITEIRTKYIGDIIETSLSEGKPFQFKPVLNIQDNLHENSTIGDIPGREVMGYLNELTFYLNSECDNNCNLCNSAYKQHHFCHKNEKNKELDFDLFQSVLNQCYNSGINTINLIGGNIFKYSKYDSVLDVLKSLKTNIHIHTHYLNLSDNILTQSLNSFTLNILFSAPFEQIRINEILNRINSSSSISIQFIVSSDAEYITVEQLMSYFPTITYQILPHYNGKNIDFFKSNVFLEKEDIFSNTLSQKEIFRNQVLNSNDFGKLTIMSDSKVYANPHFPALGTIDDDIRKLVYKEMTKGQSWFRIRDMNPCCDCVYQFLCPSPSSYELNIGKHNLCHVKS